MFNSYVKLPESTPILGNFRSNSLPASHFLLPVQQPTFSALALLTAMALFHAEKRFIFVGIIMMLYIFMNYDRYRGDTMRYSGIPSGHFRVFYGKSQCSIGKSSRNWQFSIPNWSVFYWPGMAPQWWAWGGIFLSHLTKLMGTQYTYKT